MHHPSALLALLLLSLGSASGQPAPSQEPGRLTFSPAGPAPGAEVRVTYEAPEWLGPVDEVILRARLRTPEDKAYGWGTDTRPVARLRRTAGGLYRGRFAFPDSVVFALFAVSTPRGDAVDTNLRQGWPLFAHAGVRPLPEALSQQLEDLTGRDFRGGLRVAQGRVRAYPDDPQSWYLLGFFEDQALGIAESDSARTGRLARIRQFDRELAEAPDADKASGLLWLARGVDDEVAERWTGWLLGHAPAHPTAVQFRTISALRENQEDAGARLADLERLWDEVGPAHPALLDYGFRTALQTGEVGAALRWADRRTQAYPWERTKTALALAANPATRDEGVLRLRREIERDAALREAERPLFATTGEHRQNREVEAARLQAALGRALYDSGEVEEALGALEVAAASSWDVDLLHRLAAARLAVGDSLGTARAYARLVVDPGLSEADADTARARGLRSAGLDAWTRLVAEAHGDLQAWTLDRAVRSPVPDGISLLDAEGVRVDVKSLLSAEAPTLVVMFSRYCGYCVEATPRIQALSERLSSEGVRVLIATSEPPGEDSEVFFKEHGVTGPVYHDADRALALALGTAAVPTYFVLGREGVVRFPLTSLDEVPRQVSALLAEAEPPSLREADRVRLADDVQDCIWPGWSGVPFAVLLVTPEHEFLVRHPRPSDDFALATAYDSLLQSAVYVRDRQFSPNLLATFPAVGGAPTVVVGQPERTGKSSTFWVLTLLHEHFHQLQNAQPDYYDAVAALDLSGGDETGTWMLNYPFPYDSSAVATRFADYRDALRAALSAARGTGETERVGDFLSARARLQDALPEADYRYLSFQLWQEGVARYTEYRVVEAAAAVHEPLSSFRALDDFVPYSAAADSLRRALAEELAVLDLTSRGRIAFYPIGAAEAILLDAVRPGWRRHYLSEKFYLERYHGEP